MGDENAPGLRIESGVIELASACVWYFNDPKHVQ
jgi:hypothetical protein